MRAQPWQNPGKAGPFPACSTEWFEPWNWRGICSVASGGWSRSNPPKERKRLLGPGDNLPGAFARVELGKGNARERRDCADQRLLASRKRFADDAVLG
jgi:hypothetical protein